MLHVFAQARLGGFLLVFFLVIPPGGLRMMGPMATNGKKEEKLLVEDIFRFLSRVLRAGTRRSWWACCAADGLIGVAHGDSGGGGL